MRIITDPEELQVFCLDERCAQRRIGLVPTMGYYHEAHLSLMRWARENCQTLVVSLFVNPTQFGPGEDYESYPRDLERDKELAAWEGVDVLFVPDRDKMYAENHATWVNVPDLSEHLCGKSRPTHFSGVCTVVCKLLNMALPHVAVFGRKDWQQLAIINRMVRDLNLPVKVEGRPIVREQDGLAMSSRNVYLNDQERKEASQIHVGLLEAQKWLKAGTRDSSQLLDKLRNFYKKNIPSGQIDYLEIVHPEEIKPLNSINKSALLAVAIKIGKARLIDNILLEG